MNKVGLKVLVAAFIFWYGLGYINLNYSDDYDLYETNFVIALFIIIMLVGHMAGYSAIQKRIPQATTYHDYNVGTRTFVLLIVVYATIFALLGLFRDEGMLGYHLVRAVTAVGILAFVYVLLFTGWKRLVILLLFSTIVFYSLGVYSRRPFLTLIVPLLLIPMIRNRYKIGFNRILLVLVAVFVTFLSVAYITGIRYIGEDSSLLDVVGIANDGGKVLLSGMGFDTVHLTSYVLRNYDSSNYLYGQSFLGGLLNFIPRVLWTEKPLAFGIILSGEYYGVQVADIFTNFGPGIVAEAYANGGYVAIFLVAIVLGCIVGLFDRMIENGRYDWNVVLFGLVLYPAVFFMIRGDFLNSFYEFYAKVVVIWVVTAGLGLRRRLKPWVVKKTVADMGT